MTDQRPQYGELATPEEQRIAAGLPPVIEDVPTAAEPAAPAASKTTDALGNPVPASTRSVDRFATIALLGYGLVNVVITAMSYLDLPTVMNQAMKILGIEGEFTNFAAGKLWGTVAAVILVIGWTVTAMVSIRRLRRRRVTWWLPLVGAVVTTVVASIFLTIPMMGDPAFVDYLAKMRP